MIPISVKRVMVVLYKPDFRKRFDGLLAEAYRLGADPYQGDCLLFFKKDQTQIRALCGDHLGLFLVCRRFEGSTLKTSFHFVKDPTWQEITTAELGLLFEGATFTVHKRTKPWRKP